MSEIPNQKLFLIGNFEAKMFTIILGCGMRNITEINKTY